MIQQLSVHVKDSFFFYIAASLDFYTLRFCQISLPLAHPSNAINSVQTRYKPNARFYAKKIFPGI